MDPAGTLIIYALWMAMLVWFLDPNWDRKPRHAAANARGSPRSPARAQTGELIYTVYSGPRERSLPTQEDQWPCRQFSKMSEALLWAQHVVARKGSAVMAIRQDLGRAHKNSATFEDTSSVRRSGETSSTIIDASNP